MPFVFIHVNISADNIKKSAVAINTMYVSDNVKSGSLIIYY
jgi:hypothetical protein